MSFERSIFSWVVAGVALFISGCTTEKKFGPGFIQDTNWSPSARLVYNGYQRALFQIDRPPRVELLKNIDLYRVVTIFNRSGSAVIIDTLRNYQVYPQYLLPKYSYEYRSKPMLEDNVGYTTHVEVHYKNGDSGVSNKTTFTTPPKRGAVLRRLPLPKKQASDSYWGVDLISFYKGSLLVLRDEELLKVDTSSGVATLLKNVFMPPDGYPNVYFRSLAVCRNTLLTFYYNRWNPNLITIVRLDLVSLSVDSSLKISSPTSVPVAITGYGSDLLIISYTSEEKNQFTLIDPSSGQILKEYPPFTASYWYASEMVSDGDNVSVAFKAPFDNEISPIDLSTGVQLRKHHNPVFDPQSLAWDGAHFWVIDQETRTLAKLKLEGF